MTSALLRTGAALAAAAAVLGLTAACSSGGSGAAGSPDSAKIAFLMPDIASTRYELADAPLFTAKTKELCSGCEVLYQNAQADASKQQQQADSALAQGVSAIVLDPVDSAAAATIVQKAKAQNVPVIAYDRPIPQAPPTFYVSFDNEKIGAMIAQSLVDQMKQSGNTGSLLEVNGSPTDAAAGLIKKGVHSVVDSSGIPLLAEYDTPDWKPAKAQEWVSGQITQFGTTIGGVVAANDGTGGGAVSAFKAAGVSPVPPVTGNDAELAAAQRIVAGDQFNTISKPIKTVAEAAAVVANDLVNGRTPTAQTTLFDAPSMLFDPQVVTQANLKDVLVAPAGPLNASDICTSEYAAACAKLGIG